MELCEECQEWDRGRDSSDSLVRRTVFRRKTCSLCGTWIVNPHFKLHVLRGKLAEAFVPHSFEMKPSLWSNLPQGCLEIVLARLPLGSRVRFSTVCKTWQSLLASSDFKRLCNSVEPPPAPLVCSLKYQLGKLPPRKTRAKRPAVFEVLKVGLSFLPPKFQAFHSSNYVAQDGLVCIFKVDRQKPGKGVVETQPLQMSVSHSYGVGVGDGDEDDEDEEEEDEEGDEERNLMADEVDAEEDYEGDGPVVGSSKKVVDMSFGVANPEKPQVETQLLHMPISPSHGAGVGVRNGGRDEDDEDEDEDVDEDDDDDDDDDDEWKEGDFTGEGVDEDDYLWDYDVDDDSGDDDGWKEGDFTGEGVDEDDHLWDYDVDDDSGDDDSEDEDSYKLYDGPEVDSSMVVDMRLCSSKNVAGLSFCVANPFTRTFKVLPPEFGKEDFDDNQGCWRVQLEVDADGHFSVIVLCMRKNEPTASIYRSKDNCWKATALTQQPSCFSDGLGYNNDASYWPQYVLCNGELLTRLDNSVNIHSLESGRVIWNWKRGIESFNEELGSFIEKRTLGIFNEDEDEKDEDTEPRVICNVFAWRGRFFCLEQDHEQVKVDFGVWELERSPNIWRKVSFLPKMYQELLLEPSKFRRWLKMGITGTLFGDTMYFTIAIGKQSDQEMRLCPHLVGYNIRNNRWSLSIDGVRFYFCSSFHLFRPN